jgi:uncharacterized integral membrane protein
MPRIYQIARRGAVRRGPRAQIPLVRGIGGADTAIGIARTRDRARRLVMKKFLYVALALLAGVILIQNYSVTTFRLLFWKIQMSQVVYTLLLLAIGFLLGFLTGKYRGKLW